MQAQRLPAVRGAFWLAAGFKLYRRNPPLLTTLTLGYMLIVFAFGMLQPVGQFILPLILPALTVLLANGFRALDLGNSKGFPAAALIEGLAEHRGALLRLGFLHLAGTLAVLALNFLLAGGKSSVSPGSGDETAQLIQLLSLMALYSPLLLAFWFAPLLTTWEGLTAAKSLFFSFVAAWRNWRAFLVYGLAVMLVGALLPALILFIASMISKTLVEVLAVALYTLLFLVFTPVLMTSAYLSYRDVFIQAPDGAS